MEILNVKFNVNLLVKPVLVLGLVLPVLDYIEMTKIIVNVPMVSMKTVKNYVNIVLHLVLTVVPQKHV